jgi:hypothetical protein
LNNQAGGQSDQLLGEYQEAMRLSAGQWLICIMFGCGALLLAVIIGMQMGFSNPNQLTPEEIERIHEELGQLGDEDDQVMKMAEMGITEPRVFPADEVMISDTATVLGIEANGKYRAYLATGMSDATSLHIVHDYLGGKPITMTFCDRSNCSRAFLRHKVRTEDIMMGGWSGEEMWLLIKDKRYLHTSTEVPIPDYPVEMTTWGEWKKAHPETDVYLGGQ